MVVPKCLNLELCLAIILLKTYFKSFWAIAKNPVPAHEKSYIVLLSGPFCSSLPAEETCYLWLDLCSLIRFLFVEDKMKLSLLPRPPKMELMWKFSSNLIHAYFKKRLHKPSHREREGEIAGYTAVQDLSESSALSAFA